MPGSGGNNTLSYWRGDTDNVDVQYKNLKENQDTDSARYSGSCLAGKKGLVLKILLLAVIFVIGLLIGYVIRRQVSGKSATNTGISQKSCDGTKIVVKHMQNFDTLQVQKCVLSFKDYSPSMSMKARNKISANSIKEMLKELTERTRPGDYARLAGTPYSLAMSDLIEGYFKKYSFDSVLKENYRVQLSDPGGLDKYMNNTVQLVLNNTVKFDSGSTHTNMHPYVVNSIGRNYPVKGELVYVNYGTKEDLTIIVKKYKISCKKKVLIMRLGGGLEVAEKVSAVASICGRKTLPMGIIFFPDPADVNHGEKYDSSSWWLSPNLAPSVVLRHGSAHLWGDPSTPFRPATEYVYRDNHAYSAASPQKTIVMQTVSYNDAKQLMSNMVGKVPSHFNGDLGIEYGIGPGFKNDSIKSGWEVQMDIHNEQVPKKKISNVIGVIRGTEEKDRFVLIGSHHDSLTNGAVDPGTGLAIMLEIAKILGDMKTNYNWRPRRTVVFASWDASEYGAYGSQEWIEDHLVELYGQLVIYINLEDAVTGNFTFDVEANILLNQMIYNVTKNVSCHDPMHPGMSVFKQWYNNHPDKWRRNDLIKTISGANSRDSEAFSKRVLIPTMDLHFTFNKKKYPRLEKYPVYHTAQDTFVYVEEFLDPGFNAHKTLAEVTTEIIFRMADSLILPFDCHSYVRALKEAYGNLVITANQQNLTTTSNLANLWNLNAAIRNLSKTADNFKKTFADVSSEMQARHINTKLLEAFRYLLVTHRLKPTLEYTPAKGARFIVLEKLFASPPVSNLYRNLANVMQWIRVSNGILGGSVLAL